MIRERNSIDLLVVQPMIICRFSLLTWIKSKSSNKIRWKVRNEVWLVPQYSVQVVLVLNFFAYRWGLSEFVWTGPCLAFIPQCNTNSLMPRINIVFVWCVNLGQQEVPTLLAAMFPTFIGNSNSSSITHRLSSSISVETKSSWLLPGQTTSPTIRTVGVWSTSWIA